MRPHLKEISIWLLDLVAGTPLAKAVKRNHDAANALDAAVKEMLKL
ncbi:MULTISPECIES: hypothetical protein [Pacificibacter]|nr:MULTISPECIES: hypothetical protein [Pacificibacter]MBU2935291.1 hypothetical protein [Pacificibacter marinus]MDO6615445.1 hypothetical protein [Pacificibacter sp. 1_MG-2023]